MKPISEILFKCLHSCVDSLILMWLGGKSVLNKYCEIFSFSVHMCSGVQSFWTADFESSNQLTLPHSQILFMETLSVSSFGHPVRKSGDIFSTLFLLTSSSLISGRHSGTRSSVIPLLKRERRRIPVPDWTTRLCFLFRNLIWVEGAEYLSWTKTGCKVKAILLLN